MTGGDDSLTPQPIAYRLRWRPEGVLPGAHPGRGEGAEGEFRRHVDLLRQPDPRRIDLRVSLRDPHGHLHVRQFSPRRAVPVAALVDLSGSMRFGAAVTGRVAAFASLIALSVVRSGDSFGLFGADSRLREDVMLPFARRRGLESEVAALLAGARPQGAGCDGLLDAAALLPGRRALVFLISDFLMPATALDTLLDALWRHDVVPVVVSEATLEDELPRWGFIETADLETGAARLVFMRPRLRQRWIAAEQARRAALDATFARRGLHPFALHDRLDVEALTRRLMEG